LKSYYNLFRKIPQFLLMVVYTFQLYLNMDCSKRTWFENNELGESILMILVLSWLVLRWIHLLL